MTACQRSTQSASHELRPLSARRSLLLPGVLAAVLAVSVQSALLAGDIPDRERRAGQQIAANVEARFSRLDDPVRLQRVATIMGRLARAAGKDPGFITLRLLDSPEYNAFAVPGNVIYVMRGLVDSARSDDELAAALAHEMSHLLLGHMRELLDEETPRRHIAFVVESAGSGGVLRRHVLPVAGGRQAPPPSAAAVVRRAQERELEADRAALPLLSRAGYRPEAILTMLEHLEEAETLRRAAAALAAVAGTPTPEPAASHPAAAERIRQARQVLHSLGTGLALNGGSG